MPETPIHKYARPIFSQYQVWMPRKPLMIQPISESSLPKPTSHNHLWLRIFRPNRCHIGVCLLFREFIHRYIVFAIFINSVNPTTSSLPKRLNFSFFKSCGFHVYFCNSFSIPFWFKRNIRYILSSLLSSGLNG